MKKNTIKLKQESPLKLKRVSSRSGTASGQIALTPMHERRDEHVPIEPIAGSARLKKGGGTWML